MPNKRIRDYDDGAANVTATDVIGVDRAGLDEVERVTLQQAVDATDVAGAYVPGGTDVAVADGGTGASNAADARSNLGLASVPVAIGVAASDEVTALTAGAAQATFRMPHAMTVTAVRASLTTASTSGAVTVDINEAGTSILSTLLTIDQDETTSTTAATAAVISDTSLADDAVMTVDIDGAGAGAAGLKVWIIGTRAFA